MWYKEEGRLSGVCVILDGRTVITLHTCMHVKCENDMRTLTYRDIGYRRIRRLSDRLPTSERIFRAEPTLTLPLPRLADCQHSLKVCRRQLRCTHTTRPSNH
jgi:hypothetical protein